MSEEMDITKLINEASDDSNDILYGSAQCVGALLDYPEGQDKQVMQDHPVLVVGHALITCIGFCFEKWQVLNDQSQKAKSND